MSVKNLTDIDLIIQLESGEVIIEDQSDWNRVKSLAQTFSKSQGFYGRLLESMLTLERNQSITDLLPLTI